MSNLPVGIGSLSAAEKFELIDASAPLLTETQRTELDRRVSAYEQDKSVAVPWEQVRAQLFKKQ